MAAKGIAELRGELDAAGVFRHHSTVGWIRFGLLLVLLGAWLWSIGNVPVWVTLLTVPFAAMVATTAAMLGHEGSHGSFSSSKLENRLMNFLAFPLLTGLSAVYWRHKHDAMHHGHPNVTDKDPDVDMWPFICSKEEYDKSSRPMRWFQRKIQGYMFWPMTPLLGIAMRRSSIRYLWRHWKRKGFDQQYVIDLACVGTHYALWLGGGTYLWGFWPAMAVYFGLWSLVGTMLAMIFAPAHIGLPILSNQHLDWIHQLETTRNFRTPRWASWFFVGLDYQVEHHLFPRICHQELPRARDIVRAYCQREGILHLEVGYGEAFRSVTDSLHVAYKTPAMGREEVRAAWTAVDEPAPLAAAG